MVSDECIYPNCECLDYCEAQDPYTETPKPLSKEIEEKLDWYESERILQYDICQNICKPARQQIDIPVLL